MTEFKAVIRVTAQLVASIAGKPDIIAELIDYCAWHGRNDFDDGDEQRAYRLLAEALRKLHHGEDAAPVEVQP